jgi:hypothetical protein
VQVAEKIEIALQPLRGRKFLRRLQLARDPVASSFQHRNGDRVLGIEMMIEARFADADLVGDVLKAEAFEAACPTT